MRHLLILVCTALLLPALPATAQTQAPASAPAVSITIPATMAYQGYVTQGGVPVNGLTDFRFRLYTASAGGSTVWTEFKNGVFVQDGLYNVVLGSGVSLAGIDFNVPLWLGVRVGTDPELTPRTPLTGVPYAFGLRLPFSTTASLNDPQRAVLEIGNTAAGDGLLITEAGDDGIVVRNTGIDGIRISNAGFNGLQIDGAGRSGILVNNAGIDGVSVLSAAAHSLDIKGQKNSSASVSNHVALIENNSSTTSSGPDVLALKSSPTTPGSSTNFITFFNGSNAALGRIEGNGSGGIVLNTPGGDYAEYLPHHTPGTPFQPGDVVGVYAGHISHRTEGAEGVMVITDQPAVLGNAPATENTEGFEAVSFVGQVPVRVTGPVVAGDYLLASGRADGTAVAVSPEAIRHTDLSQLVGRAWESGVDGRVNTVVGLDRTEVLTAILARQQAQLDRQAARLEALEAWMQTNTGSR